MSQAKITSFFARKSSHPIKPPEVPVKCCSDDLNNDETNDSDVTDIYDYQEEIASLTGSESPVANGADQLDPKDSGTDSMHNEDMIADDVSSQQAEINESVDDSKCSGQSEDSQQSLANDNLSLRRSSRQKVIKPMQFWWTKGSKKENDENEDENEKKAMKRKRSSKVKDTKDVKDIKSSQQKSTTKDKSIKKSKSTDSVILVSDESPPEKRKYIAVPEPNIEYLKLWTHTHEPLSTTELVGHSSAVEQFKKWLTTWDETFNQANDSDFDSDDEVEREKIIDGKCFYIQGPNGVGKTTLVYTIAREQGYKVLEYNASSLRLTPSLIQKDLSESLQSYYINQSSVANFFGAKPKPTEQPKPKRGRPKKKRKEEGIKASEPQQESSVKLTKSLILLDDIDGIIHENRCYSDIWRALRQIITDGRKPIVFTSSLERHFLCNELHYFCSVKLTPIDRATMFEHLGLVCQKENSSYCGSLDILSDFMGDARKALNQAHFWISDVSQSAPPQEDPAVEGQVHFAGDSFAGQASLLDLLSLEDIYQTEFDRLCTSATIECDLPYNRHLYDNRLSLMVCPSQSTDLYHNLTSLCKSFDSLQTGTEANDKLLSDLILDHYTQLDTQCESQFADSFALFDTLCETTPDLVQELCTRKQSANCRSKRTSKASLFDYLN